MPRYASALVSRLVTCGQTTGGAWIRDLLPDSMRRTPRHKPLPSLALGRRHLTVAGKLLQLPSGQIPCHAFCVTHWGGAQPCVPYSLEATGLLHLPTPDLATSPLPTPPHPTWHSISRAAASASAYRAVSSACRASAASMALAYMGGRTCTQAGRVQDTELVIGIIISIQCAGGDGSRHLDPGNCKGAFESDCQAARSAWPVALDQGMRGAWTDHPVPET
jgi:hypothetical protein